MMIFTALIVASTLVGSASAFVAPPAATSSVITEPSQSTRRSGWSPNLRATKKSQSIPFVNCPPFLDGEMAGDVGFDPLGFAASKLDLTTMREAEIKHARLAMLAAAGWPLSELFNKNIASQFGMNSALDEATHRVPSVLNGGMGKISPIYWGACIVGAAAVDLFVINKSSKQKGYFPGKLDFDPLGFYPKSLEDQKWMQTAEIKNGRLAMIAITAFAFTEFVSGHAIIDQFPIFFYPITETIFGDIGTFGVHAPEAATSVLMDAATSSDPAAALDAAAAVVTPSLDAVTAAPDVAATVSPLVDDAVSSATSAAASSSSSLVEDNADLYAAKKRIVELEAKLAAIGDLTH